MSTYEIRENSGTLFKNDRRDKESQPNARGKAMIGGVLYEVSAWTKQGQKGPFQSLSFKRLDSDQRRPEPQAPRGSLKDQLNDDLPWD